MHTYSRQTSVRIRIGDRVFSKVGRCVLIAFLVIWSVDTYAQRKSSKSPSTRTMIITVNPYKNVDWRTYKQHKAALHVHTLQSDGYHTVDEVVRSYRKAGFTIVALTDHDKMEPNAQFARGRIDWSTFETAGTPFPKDPKPENYPFNTTWPWTDFGAPDPKELGMVGIEGAEISYRHHMNSFFSSYGTGYTAVDEDEMLTAMQEAGGLAFFNHPGNPAPFSGGGQRSLEWYEDRFAKYPPTFLIGMDITGGAFTEGLWDQLLLRFMPGRQILGFATEDMHRLPPDPSKSPHTIFILKDLDSASVRKAMESGQFLFSRPSRRGATGEFPTVDSMEFDDVAGTITIHASNYDTIKWISAPLARHAVEDTKTHSIIWQGGEVVHVGETLNYRKTPNIRNYVRAEIQRTEGGITYRTFTNAFGMAEAVESKDGIESVQIGDLEWMTRNLDVTTFRDGTTILQAKTSEEWANAAKEGKPAWCYYNFDPSRGDKFGRLYNWFAVADSAHGGLAPAGWKIPTNDDWTKVTEHLGGYPAAGIKMKSESGWQNDGNGTNTSRFAGLPGGVVHPNGSSAGVGLYGYWWSSSAYLKSNAWDWMLYYNDPLVRTNHHKGSGLSVRCVRE